MSKSGSFYVSYLTTIRLSCQEVFFVSSFKVEVFSFDAVTITDSASNVKSFFLVAKHFFGWLGKKKSVTTTTKMVVTFIYQSLKVSFSFAIASLCEEE